MLYGNNPANPGDGRNAGIGIENATGTDALQFSFLEGVIDPNTAFRYEPVPSGLVHGTVTDANDGAADRRSRPRRHAGRPDHHDRRRRRPTASGSGPARTPSRSADELRRRDHDPSTVADGERRRPSTSPSTRADRRRSTAGHGQRDRRLRRDHGVTSPCRTPAARRSTGRPRSATRRVIQPPLPTPTVDRHPQADWAPADPGGVPARPSSRTRSRRPTPRRTIINDPAGDSLDVERRHQVRAGSDGQSLASMAIDFAPGTPMTTRPAATSTSTPTRIPSTGLPGRGPVRPAHPGRRDGVLRRPVRREHDGDRPDLQRRHFDLVAFVAGDRRRAHDQRSTCRSRPSAATTASSTPAMVVGFPARPTGPLTTATARSSRSATRRGCHESPDAGDVAPGGSPDVRSTWAARPCRPASTTRSSSSSRTPRSRPSCRST